jgi:endoglucanase
MPAGLFDLGNFAFVEAYNAPWIKSYCLETQRKNDQMNRRWTRMADNIEDLLKNLSETPGPPGYEQHVKAMIVEELKPYCLELREDPLGNLIARIGAEDGYKVGILAHMDEVGIIVTSIRDNGLMGFELVGMIDERPLLGCVVNAMTSDGRLVPGVIGSKSRHLQTPEELSAPVSHKQLWIDVGANSRDEVLRQGIEIGCGVVFSTRFHIYPNGTILGKALDNRMSCGVLIEALKSLSSSLKNTTVYGMFTIQEEIGAKGARVVAYDVQPHMTITLDNVPTKNVDELDPHDIDLNRGPVIRVFDWYPAYAYGMFTHRAIRARLMKVAQEEKIKHQVDVLIGTYLDSSQVHLTAGGIPGGSICFPRRYSHSPVELSHLNDVKNGLELLKKFIESLEEDPIEFGRNY